MLAPGLVCFTTVGRLWYVPGVLLVAAGCLASVGLRGDLRIVAHDIERNGTRILAITLAVLYLGLGVVALGTSGILGVVGSLVVINLLLLNPRLPTPVGIAIVVAAAVPFAVATWWSVVTPLVAATSRGDRRCRGAPSAGDPILECATAHVRCAAAVDSSTGVAPEVPGRFTKEHGLPTSGAGKDER